MGITNLLYLIFTSTNTVFVITSHFSNKRKRFLNIIMEITDYSKRFDRTSCNVNHAPFFPKNIFCIIAGATGSGKTNVLLNFLLKDGILDYSSIYVYSPTLHQFAYKYLKEYYYDIDEN